MEMRKAVVQTLLSDPRLQNRLGSAPSFADVLTALRQFGEPQISLQGQTSVCQVELGDGTTVRSSIESPANPAAATLLCLLDLIEDNEQFNVALLLGGEVLPGVS